MGLGPHSKHIWAARRCLLPRFHWQVASCSLSVTILDRSTNSAAASIRRGRHQATPPLLSAFFPHYGPPIFPRVPPFLPPGIACCPPTSPLARLFLQRANTPSLALSLATSAISLKGIPLELPRAMACRISLYNVTCTILFCRRPLAFRVLLHCRRSTLFQILVSFSFQGLLPAVASFPLHPPSISSIPWHPLLA